MIATKAVADNSELRLEFERLFESQGVARSYIDYGGDTVEIALENRLRVLGLLGMEIQNPSELAEAVSRLEKAAACTLLDRTVVATHGASMEVVLHVAPEALAEPMTWTLRSENNDCISGCFDPAELGIAEIADEDGRGTSARIWQLPDLTIGYYSLEISSPNTRAESFLLVSPARCFEPQWALESARLAGLSVHLYTLRSEENWGMGDFGDLRKLLRHSAAHKLDFVVLNPLHILDSQNPDQCSPYSPLDRRFLSPLYIEIEAAADFAESDEARRLVSAAKFQEALRHRRSLPHVDYAGVYTSKHEVLAAMFAHFSSSHRETNSARGREFSRWVESKGPSLHEFCRFEAERHDGHASCLGNPDFHLYLQWLAEAQLADCQRLAETLGMAVGLIRDLAVGGNVRSAEVQLNKELFSTEAGIGAPPDSFAPQGQNWGLPPMRPAVMIETRFSHFIELLRSNMCSCSALRIDHVMALMRLWWSPADGSSDRGGYVYYPVDLLFAILRIESQRWQCLVIGEDLGVVPPQIGEYMKDSGVFGNTLFYFEKYDAQTYKKPEHFPPKTLSMIANHDVPTLSAWWSKSDLLLRQELGLYADEQQLGEAVAARESDLIQLLHWLDEQNLLPQSWRHFNIHYPFDKDLCAAILQGNARSAAQLVSTQLEDLCGTALPVNIPGTSSEYPNWRRKLPFSIDALFEDPEFSELLDSFVGARAL